MAFYIIGDVDLIFLGQTSLGIKNNSQKEKNIQSRQKKQNNYFLKKCKMLLRPFITYNRNTRTYSLISSHAFRSGSNPLKSPKFFYIGTTILHCLSY